MSSWWCFSVSDSLRAFPVTGMTSDGPPGHFVQGFWSPVWWPCFGDRRHKCSSTEFASARRTVNPCIICQKPWTEEFWTVFKHRWGQIFFAWHLQPIQGLWCLFELAAFLQKAGRHGNKPWLSGPWCLTVVVLGMQLIRRPWVANFEMCHLRSLGRVANFKNEACGNGGIGFDFLSF